MVRYDDAGRGTVSFDNVHGDKHGACWRKVESERVMKRFFEITFKPFFALTGLATALGALNAFWPGWTVENVEKMHFVREYTIVVQHWGMMLGLVGVFMMVAAFRAEWRTPVLLFSLLEKAFVVYLVLVNVNEPYAQGLKIGAAMDATVVLYTIAYFGVYGFKSSPK